MSRLRKRTLRVVRRVTGTGSSAEHALRQARMQANYTKTGAIKQQQFCAFAGDPDRRIGIYGYGGCDVWAIRAAGPELRELTGATGAALARGRARFTRSDLILQAWDGVEPDHVSEVVQRLDLDPIMFQPALFKPEFSLPDLASLGRYPKNVVVLTISTDLVRTLYRHREHGFLVDPGGFWLGSDIGHALQDLEQVKWFSKTFEKTGRIELETSMSNIRRLIGLVRSETGAEVVVFNCLTVDPGRHVLDYKLSHSPHRTRRREFGLALIELAREMDFSIVDIDRVVKGYGVSGLGDFVKFTPGHMQEIASEFVRVVRERELLPTKSDKA